MRLGRGEGFNALVGTANRWPAVRGCPIARFMIEMTSAGSTVLEGLTEAAIIVGGGRVLSANAAARSLLGDQIEGGPQAAARPDSSKPINKRKYGVDTILTRVQVDF